jgi:hypothetical protein
MGGDSRHGRPESALAVCCSEVRANVAPLTRAVSDQLAHTATTDPLAPTNHRMTAGVISTNRMS